MKEETALLLAADRTVSLQSHRKLVKVITPHSSLNTQQGKIFRNQSFSQTAEKAAAEYFIIKSPSRRTTKTGQHLQIEQKEKFKTYLKKTVKLY